MQETQVGSLPLHGHMLAPSGRTVHAARVQHFYTMCAWQAQVTLALRMSVSCSASAESHCSPAQSMIISSHQLAWQA